MEYKRPESVLVVVYTAAGEVLLLKRAAAPAGVWQSVTGSLRRGETARAAAGRELVEETGIRARPVPTGLVNRFEIVPEARPRYAPGVVFNTEHVFTLELPARAPVRIDPSEHTDWRWLPADEAVAAVWSWSERAAIRAATRPDS